MTRLLALIFLMVTGFATVIQAQHVWQGRVEDASTGQPLPGATLTVAGTSSGTQTDPEGRFRLEGLSEGQTVEVRFLGYQTQRLTVRGGRSNMAVGLEPQAFELKGLTVSAFESGRPLIETAGSVAVVAGPSVRPAHDLSLAPALNTVAGVRMEESGYGGSSRISIRGSLLRSPFGIRNVKVYWNDIPLTDPGGASSRFNSLDAGDLGRVEIIKGPAGSLYGSGTGGVLLLQSRRTDLGENSVGLEHTGGAFGLSRSVLRANWAEGSARVRLSLLEQDQRGYRDHQRVDKQSLQLSAGLTPSTRRDVGLHLFHYDGTYQLPGPLTAAQVEESPRMAIPFSKAGDARVSLRNTGLALSQRILLDARWQNTTSLGVIVQDKENPSGTSPAFNQYEISSFYGLSGRSVFRFVETADDPWTLQFGLEAQTGFSLEKYYANDAGRPGAMRSDAEVDASTWSAFAQIEKEWDGWIATAGLSVNGTRYQVVDRLGEQGLAGSADLRFGPTAAPRLALVRRLGASQTLHGSLSYGFSPPTQWEVKTLAGVNADLRPEQGLNAEIGWKGQSNDGRFAGDVSVYRFGLRQALLQQFTAQELPYFTNAGSTDQWGVEAAASGQVVEGPAFGLRLWGSGSWNSYHFGDYVSYASTAGGIALRDYGGNRMPGIARWSGSLGADMRLPWGWSAALTGRYMDRIPIDDANTVYSREWLLVSARLDGGWEIGRRLRAGLRLGVENLTDTYWDNLLALNGTAGRYFNPGPPRHVYVQGRVGVRL